MQAIQTGLLQCKREPVLSCGTTWSWFQYRFQKMVRCLQNSTHGNQNTSDAAMANMKQVDACNSLLLWLAPQTNQEFCCSLVNGLQESDVLLKPP